MAPLNQDSGSVGSLHSRMCKLSDYQQAFIVRFPASVCALCRNGDMDWNDAALLMEIVAMAHDEGYCYASNGHFVRGRITVWSVKRRIARLIADGWIKTNNGTCTGRKLYPNKERLGSDPIPLRRPEVRSKSAPSETAADTAEVSDFGAKAPRTSEQKRPT